MPNWCSTTIAFYSRNKDQLEAFRNKALEIQNGKETQKNDFGPGWLGDYANTFYPEIGARNIECRGTSGDITEIEYIKSEFYVFRMWTWTAWTAKIGLFYKITKDFFPDIKIAYVSEEPGCGYYCIWDEENLFFVEDYYLDIAYPTADGSVDYGEEHEYRSIKSAWEWLSEHLPFKVELCDDEQKFEQHINEEMDKYVEEHNLDSGEYYCVFTKYYDMHPSAFPFEFQ